MQNIIRQLQEKVRDYRPIPFWSWNDKLEIDALKAQIHWMHENGIGGFFMHARTGLQTEYLSDDWMRCIEECCREAQALDMDAWAYDENGFPSGFAGGKLLENMENRNRYILHTIGPFDNKATVSYQLETEELVRVDSGVSGKEYLNLYIKYSASTVDILNPDVVKQFLEVTHEQYKNHFGEEFSKLIKGFFTDEPQYYRDATPYTPMIQKYFREQYDEEILNQLGLLFVEKKGYRQFRYRYWSGMQKLMLESFAKQIYEWSDEHEVQLTGHYVEENSLGWQVMCCGGIMPFYEYEHIPGCDCLAKDVGNPLPSKQVGSVARQLGKKRVLTESFGCCGWDIKPGELRRIAGYQYANGVNLLCHHLLPYSERGARKRDYPAHFSQVNPWVDENFKEFNEYFTRLGYLLGESEEPVHVAMLHPVRSTYFDYKREKGEGDFGTTILDRQFREHCDTLTKRGIPYHFLDETLLETHGYVENQKIGCGQCEYEYLVLPDMITMGRTTEALIREFVSQGGKLLLLGSAPTYLEGESHGYPYLQSNCTLEQLEQVKPFLVEKHDTELCYAYRVLDGKPFLYVQNASEEQSYSQTFTFGDDIKSFLMLDLITLQTKRVGMTINLEPNEGVLLFPDREEVEERKELQSYTLQFEQAEVDFQTNFLTVDIVRYSKDGIDYSEPILCARLFEELLVSRYEGKIYLRYEFEAKVLPSQLVILAETQSATGLWVNGTPVTFSESCREEASLQKADVSSLVCVGMNQFDMVLDWYQREETYYALFGENVTDGLRNCLTYDSEIEAIYLAGKFGVYSHKNYEYAADGQTLQGQAFYIGEVPRRVSEPTTEGFPFFRGNLTMKQKVTFPHEAILLKVEGRYASAVVRVNGQEAGKLFFDRQLDISKYAKQGENEVEITFTVGNRNLLGPFLTPGPDGFIGPMHFLVGNLPREDFRYRLYLFYEKTKKE